MLLDQAPDAILSQEEGEICPREQATATMIKSASAESASVLNGLRQKLCLSLMNMMSLIATDTVDCETMQNGTFNGGEKRKTSQFATDPKICSEVMELSDLILTRRGAHHKSANVKTIWRGQKEILSDFVLTSESDCIIAARSRCNDEVLNGSDCFYKDGEGELFFTQSLIKAINHSH